MKWNKQDMKNYLQAKEYVDTAILPLVPVTFGQEEEKQVSQAFQKEILDIMVHELEKEYKGRVLALPSYIYSSIDLEELARINRFTEGLNQMPFKHIFYITFDQMWKMKERDLNGILLWVPILKEGDIQQKDTQNMINDQIHQLKDLIKNYWNS